MKKINSTNTFISIYIKKIGKGRWDLVHWYEKLNQYFPVEEMKSREHMETLLMENSIN
jgi:hypothetical protein